MKGLTVLTIIKIYISASKNHTHQSKHNMKTQYQEMFGTMID